MPKMKTHSGANKRFRLTGTGKVLRRRANRKHLFEHKSSRSPGGWLAKLSSPRQTQEDQEVAGEVAQPASRE